jgi:hypothetical protein
MEPIWVPEFTSERTFEIFDADAMYSFVLLRSSGGSFSENVDLIFAGVLYLEIPSTFSGLTVSVPCDEEAVELEKRFTTYQSANHDGEFVYAIESGGSRFHVVASTLWIHVNTFPTSSLTPMAHEGKEGHYAKHVLEEYRLKPGGT